jgi:hypothetical protein
MRAPSAEIRVYLHLFSAGLQGTVWTVFCVASNYSTIRPNLTLKSWL